MGDLACGGGDFREDRVVRGGVACEEDRGVVGGEVEGCGTACAGAYAGYYGEEFGGEGGHFGVVCGR